MSGYGGYEYDNANADSGGGGFLSQSNRESEGGEKEKKPRDKQKLANAPRDASGHYGPVGGAIDLAARHLAAGESVLFATPRNAARVQINRAMQARLNPPGDPAKEIAPRQATAADGTATLPWRVGDVVMNLKNAHVGDAYLANGDVGRVLRIDKAERKVFARFGDAKVVQEYPVDHPDLTHAWCVTAHKSQGDEADRVVFYMDGSVLASREMLNTVVTRAKTGASLIVSRPALAACLSKSVRDERCTRLAKRLGEAFAGVRAADCPDAAPEPAPEPAAQKRQKTSPYFA